MILFSFTPMIPNAKNQKQVLSDNNYLQQVNNNQNNKANMQQKIIKKVHTRCSTQSQQNNWRLHPKQYIHLMSSQSRLKKRKFIQEYGKLSKQFKNILMRKKKQSGKIGGGRQRKIWEKDGEIINHDGDKYQIYSRNKDNNKNNQYRSNGIGKCKESRYDEDIGLGSEQKSGNHLYVDIMQSLSKVTQAKKDKPNIYHLSIIPKKSNFIMSSTSYPQEYIKNSESTFAQQQIVMRLQHQKRQKINADFTNIEEILAHFHNLYKIRELVDVKEKNSYVGIIRNIKRYVMNYNKADISKFQNLLKIEQEKDKLKIFLCVEKIAVIGILDSMIREREVAVKIEGKTVLDAIMGVYMSTFEYIMSEGIYKNRKDTKRSMKMNEDRRTMEEDLNENQKYRQSIEACLDMLQAEGIDKKKDLQSTTQFMLKRIQPLFNHNLPLVHKIKQLFTQTTRYQINFTSLKIRMIQPIVNSINPPININRFFYYLLCQYARNINNEENGQLIKGNKNLLDFFVTCPVPHLVYAPIYKITIVLQLEGVLALVKPSLVNINQQSKQFPEIGNRKLQRIKTHAKQVFLAKQIVIKFRPYVLELIEWLSKRSEVVIMTSLMPQNIPVLMNKYGSKSYRERDKEKQKQLECLDRIFRMCSALLFKYHYVRYKGVLVKDISRLGRNMEDIILIQSIDNKINEETIDKDKGQKDPLNITAKMQTSSAYLYIENILEISQWKGNPRDKQLVYLKEVLKKILVEKDDEKDVRKILERYRYAPNGSDDEEDRQMQSFYYQKNCNGIFGDSRNWNNINVQ